MLILEVLVLNRNDEIKCHPKTQDRCILFWIVPVLGLLFFSIENQGMISTSLYLDISHGLTSSQEILEVNAKIHPHSQKMVPSPGQNKTELF